MWKSGKVDRETLPLRKCELGGTKPVHVTERKSWRREIKTNLDSASKRVSVSSRDILLGKRSREAGRKRALFTNSRKRFSPPRKKESALEDAPSLEKESCSRWGKKRAEWRSVVKPKRIRGPKSQGTFSPREKKRLSKGLHAWRFEGRHASQLQELQHGGKKKAREWIRILVPEVERGNLMGGKRSSICLVPLAFSSKTWRGSHLSLSDGETSRRNAASGRAECQDMRGERTEDSCKRECGKA